jgi:hypothetical protein
MADTNWLGTLIQYVVGPVVVIIIGWLGVEKWRKQRQERRDLVSTWRNTLVPLLNAEPQATVGAGDYRYAFMRNENYASLRQHLRPEVVKQLEGETVHIAKDGPPFPRTLILDEIARIARQWNIP